MVEAPPHRRRSLAAAEAIGLREPRLCRGHDRVLVPFCEARSEACRKPEPIRGSGLQPRKPELEGSGFQKRAEVRKPEAKPECKSQPKARKYESV